MERPRKAVHAKLGAALRRKKGAREGLSANVRLEIRRLRFARAAPTLSESRFAAGRRARAWTTFIVGLRAHARHGDGCVAKPKSLTANYVFFLQFALCGRRFSGFRLSNDISRDEKNTTS
jgi:hypothetical protein